MARARESMGEEALGFVKGFRYLMQDKRRGTMGGEGFVEGVRWCAGEGYVFELGVDGTEGGGSGNGGEGEGEGRGGDLWQLEEAVGFLGRVYAGLRGGSGEGVVVVIGMWICVSVPVCGWGWDGMGVDGAFAVGVDHMCKPDMRSDDADPETRHAMFSEWEERIKQFARFPNTYMKLSGAFSQIAPLPSHDDARPWSVTPELRAAKSRIAPWVAAVFRAFGPERIMFGSDWPVCNLGRGGGKVAWRNWRWVVEDVVRDLCLSEGEKRAVWAGTAARAYSLS